MFEDMFFNAQLKTSWRKPSSLIDNTFDSWRQVCVGKGLDDNSIVRIRTQFSSAMCHRALKVNADNVSRTAQYYFVLTMQRSFTLRFVMVRASQGLFYLEALYVTDKGEIENCQESEQCRARRWSIHSSSNRRLCCTLLRPEHCRYEMNAGILISIASSERYFLGRGPWSKIVYFQHAINERSVIHSYQTSFMMHKSTKRSDV
jgi:hypothetical protein